jgi:hypothetical protein
MITWKQFKDAVEAAGVTDNTQIQWANITIDVFSMIVTKQEEEKGK